MAEIRPFGAIRPQKGYEDRVAALPYDVFSLQEAQKEVEREPLSFLAIDRPETISKEGENIYENAGRLLREQIEAGIYVQDELPCFYVYELTAGGRSQTGIGGLTKVDDYLCGAIRRHEATRADKEKDRIAHVEACMAQTGPIFLACRAREDIRCMTETCKERKPLYDFTAADGVRHRLWQVAEVETVEALYEAFGQAGEFYIADGHHRCSAAASYALKRRSQKPSYDGEEPWNFILSVVFMDDELEIMDYNRVVKDLNGLTEGQFLSRIGKYFDVEFDGQEPVKPQHKGIIAMYLRHGWYTLSVKEAYQSADPVEGLDAALLQKLLLAPVLGIREPRTDKRISFVGGIRGTDELVRLVGDGAGAAFWLYPTAMRELFSVADAGRLMPPKSTWFEPKLRSGLLLYSMKEDGRKYEISGGHTYE